MGSRLTSRFEVTGHGIGKLLAPLFVRQMRRDIPANLGRVKAVVEQREAASG